NAGVASQMLLTDVSEEEYDHVMDSNVKSAFLTTRAFLPSMVRNKKGCIINVSSMWGQVGASCEVVYSASKAALIGMTKALAKEVGPSGIRVNCIAPGVIDTKMNAMHSEETIAGLAEDTPLGRLGTPEDVADVAVFLAGPRASFMTGQVLGVNGGLVI
ncbi:MAG: SDR family oxidoreductase, partial [Clostridia bacterium]|nr:SDR family oxidoreductase [Clostridia bacterium]